MAPIIVIGAGVIGLQTAIRLLDAGHKVTIIAKHWPGDKSVEYTSPWAGAIWRTHATKLQPEQCEWGLENYKALLDIAKNEPEKAKEMGIMQCPISVYSSSTDGGDHWYSSDVENFRMLDTSTIPAGGPKSGHAFTTTAINPSKYLDYLLSRAKELGGNCIKAELPTSQGLTYALTTAMTLVQNMEDFKDIEQEDINPTIVNCTGLSSKNLIPDFDLYPIRGQTLLARVFPSPAQEILLWDTSEFVCHIVPRPGTDIFLIGGTKDKDNWDPVPTPEITELIISRIKKLLGGPDGKKEVRIEVLAEQVGLRPSRRGGPRVEVERRDGVGVGDGWKVVNVVHCYGHAGAGYVNALGSANKVVGLVKELSG